MQERTDKRTSRDVFAEGFDHPDGSELDYYGDENYRAARDEAYQEQSEAEPDAGEGSDREDEPTVEAGGADAPQGATAGG